jgi:hypothetical protein
MYGEADLLEVVQTAYSTGSFTRLLHRWKDQANKNTDHTDDHQ